MADKVIELPFIPIHECKACGPTNHVVDYAPLGRLCAICHPVYAAKAFFENVRTKAI